MLISISAHVHTNNVYAWVCVCARCARNIVHVTEIYLNTCLILSAIRYLAAGSEPADVTQRALAAYEKCDTHSRCDQLCHVAYGAHNRVGIWSAACQVASGCHSKASSKGSHVLPHATIRYRVRFFSHHTQVHNLGLYKPRKMYKAPKVQCIIQQ